MRILKFVALMLGALTLTLPTLAPVQAQANRSGAKAQGGGGKSQGRAGAPTGKAKSNVNKPKTSSSYQRPAQSNSKSTANRSGNGNKNKVSNQQAYKAGQASGNRNQRDVVVVNGGGHGNGYYDNGNYHGRPDYDDDDDDFLEFVGKTAAITAGVSAVAAVIGSVSNDKPDDCQPVNSNGTSYLYCNGTYYQQVQQSGQPAYQVVAPPQ